MAAREVRKVDEKAPRFKVGDRVRLVNIINEDPREPDDGGPLLQRHVWRNGRFGTVTNVRSLGVGHRSDWSHDRTVGHHGYEVQWDGFAYSSKADSHSPNGILLESGDEPTDEEMAEIMDSIRKAVK